VRRRLVVGNWKMNPATLVEAVDLAVQVGAGSGDLDSEIVICPPFLWLTAVAAAAPHPAHAKSASTSTPARRSPRFKPTRRGRTRSAPASGRR